MVLEKINQVNDIKKIPPEEYEQLAGRDPAVPDYKDQSDRGTFGF